MAERAKSAAVVRTRRGTDDTAEAREIDRSGIVTSAIRDTLTSNRSHTLRALTKILPAELWCCAWELLPLRDRIAVTQTCKHFRRIALACAGLWTRVEVEIARHPTQLAPTTYFAALKRALQWFGAAPLDLRVIVSVSTSYEIELKKPFTELATLCGPHLSRIKSLALDVADIKAYSLLLECLAEANQELKALPTLRRFRIINRGLGWLVGTPTVRPIPWKMPALSELDMVFSSGLAMSEVLPLVPGGLTSLSCGIHSADDLIAVLERSASLTYLRLAMRSLSGSGDFAHESARVLNAGKHLRDTANLQQVVIEWLQDHQETVVLALLDRLRKCRNILLEYNPATRDVGGFKLFAHANADMHLSCLSPNGGISVAVERGDRLVSREILFPLMTGSMFVSRVWQHIDPAKVTELTIDNRLWHRLFEHFASSGSSSSDADAEVVLPNLRVVNLRVQLESSAFVQETVGVCREEPRLFSPALRVVCLMVKMPTTVVVRLDSVARLLRLQLGLTRDRPLQMLRCEGFVVVGMIEDLYILTDVVKDGQ
ncbi:hypothetical protein BKA62DRAFT_92885 [Auriculariales sp. MPI-PUGE-AT-0066]|nr:hypothetical protein BKA62DRAFT_92885 [Auriculariales sp. MPI-PUGE-AT-0066]